MRRRIHAPRNIPDTLKIKSYIVLKSRNRPLSSAAAISVWEMAENLKGAGLDVAIVELADHLIAPLDFDMAADVHRYLREKGVRLYLNNSVKAMDGGQWYGPMRDLEGIYADMVVLAVGVRPETALAVQCGIPCNSRGAIVVNRRMQTGVPGIYAVDKSGRGARFLAVAPAFITLAGPANKQAAWRRTHRRYCFRVYWNAGLRRTEKIFDMTVATTGSFRMKNAAAAGIDYDKAYTYSASHASYYPGGSNMSVKALWDKKTKRLIGAQIVGFDGVDKRMDVLAAAIRFGAKITDLTELELCYAPPFGSAKDPVNMLGYVGENIVKFGYRV